MHMSMFVSGWRALDHVWEPADHRPCSVAQVTPGLTLLIEGEFKPRSAGLLWLLSLWTAAASLSGRSRVLRPSVRPLSTAYPHSAVLGRPCFSFMAGFGVWPWPVHRPCLPYSALRLQNGLLPAPIHPALGRFSTRFRQFPPLPIYFHNRNSSKTGQALSSD